MILVSKDDQKKYRKTDFWSKSAKKATLNGLLLQNAKQIGDALALCDAPDRESWTSGKAKNLNWHDLNEKVDLLARLLASLGLNDDTVIAVYGAQTVDMIITTLAIHRAGYISAHVPLFWRETEITNFLSEVQARAIITTDHVENDMLALRCRDIAQNLFSMKFVLGFGDNLPDGVVDLNHMLDVFQEMPKDETILKELSPDDVVSIHPTALQSQETEIALPRSSNQWLAAAKALFDDLSPCQNILNPFALSGFTGFIVTLVYTFQEKSCVHLHHYRSENNLSGHLDLLKPDLVLLPFDRVTKQKDRFSNNQNTIIGAVWKNNHLGETIAPTKENKIFDITLLNEIAALGFWRKNNKKQPEHLPLQVDNGSISLSLRGSGNSRLKKPLQISGGEILCEGAGVPEALFPSNSEKRALSRLRNKEKTKTVFTHIACRVDGEDSHLCEPIGFLVDTIGRHGQVISAHELDILYQSIPGIDDAAYFISPEDGRLNVAVVSNSAPTLQEFNNGLAHMGVTYLKFPDALYETDEIKRGLGNVVLRNELNELVEQEKARQFIKKRQQQAAS